MLSEFAFLLFSIIEVLTVFGKLSDKAADYPGWTPHIIYKLGGCCLHLRDDLDCRSSISNDCDFFVFPVKVLVPISVSMRKKTGEVVVPVCAMD